MGSGLVFCSSEIAARAAPPSHDNEQDFTAQKEEVIEIDLSAREPKIRNR